MDIFLNLKDKFINTSNQLNLISDTKQTMQLPQKPFGSQNSIKQLYRQYSTTFKNTEIDKNIPMTQSSNLPFDKFYNAFNSTGHIKNLTLDRFKHSEAKSIIEKLMQTKEFTTKNKEEELAFLNEIQNMDPLQEKGPITLSKTEEKIFFEVVNLLYEIQTIQSKTQAENEQFFKLKLELKKQGIQLPDIEQKQGQIRDQIFKRYSSQELEKILVSNDQLQIQIDTITTQLTNFNQANEEQRPLESIIAKNSLLKNQLSNIKNQIINAGEIDDQDIFQLNLRIDELKHRIFILEQKRMGKLTDTDEELRHLKQENQTLRQKTIQLLKTPTYSSNQRKSEALRILKFQEEQKKKYLEQMNSLKIHYENLLKENSALKSEKNFEEGSHYEAEFQVESKVSPFRNLYSNYRAGYDKENYFQNQEPKSSRNAQNISYADHFSKKKNEIGNNFEIYNISDGKRNCSNKGNNYARGPEMYF